MSYNYYNEPFLPWVESENDRRFKRIVTISILVFGILGVIIGLLPVPEPEQKSLQEVAPRLAKLILEKKQPPPPPPKPKVKKKKAEKPKPKPKKKVAKKPKPKPKREAARKKAERTGLLALSDELADLRETVDLASVSDNNLQKSSQARAPAINPRSNVLTARAGQGSGGINTGKLSRNTGGSELARRQTTNVKSNLPTGRSGARATRGKGSKAPMRDQNEIELVFQKNKGAINRLYQRALRKDPTLQGKVVLELTISPSGKVVKCRILSSELNNPALERRLVARVKMFRFKARNVETVTVKYPIDFLPS